VRQSFPLTIFECPAPLTKEARLYNGAKTASSKMVLGKLDSYMEKNEIRTLPNTIHKDKLNGLKT